MRHLLKKLLVACLVLGPGLAAAIELPPDAGRSLQQIQRQPQFPARGTVEIPQESQPKPPAKAGTTTRINVKGFRITGATQFGAGQLNGLIADGAGKALTLTELQELAYRVTRYYRDHGYLTAHAYLPAQDIQNGAVEIAVLEGRYGKIAINNPKDVAGGAISGQVGNLKSGGIIETKPLERSLLLASDLPGVKVQSTLAPGEATGTADLTVDVESTPMVTGVLSVDNYGNRFTGRTRGGPAVNINNPFGLGDRAALSVLSAGEGLNYLHTSYDLPVGNQGARVGFGYNFLHYRLGEQFENSDSNGDVHQGSLFLSHPFIRSRDLNLYGTVAYDYKRLEDRVDQFHRYRNNNRGTLGLQTDFRDPLGGTNSITFAVGIGGIDITADTRFQADDAKTTRTEGAYGKFNLQALSLHPFADRFAFYAALQGQAATRNLDPSEKFFLGGPYGVRAYPQGEGFGDQGYIINAEIRYRLPLETWLPGSLQVAGFFDHGQIFPYVNQFAPGIPNSRSLYGPGLGLAYAAPWGTQLRADCAFQVGPEKAVTDTDKSAQFWLTAMQTF